jgi:hypothetical protein
MLLGAVLLVSALVAALAPLARATPTFLTPVDLSAAGQDAYEPQVASDANGNVLTVWTRSDGSFLRVQAVIRAPDGTFGPVETLSPDGEHSFEPQVAFDPSGNAIAVWTDGDRIQAAFRPVDGGFGPPQTISQPGSSAPQIAIDSNGKAIAVWERGTGSTLAIQAAIRPPGGAFGAVEPVSGTDGVSYGSAVAAGPDLDNNAAVLWTRSDGTNLRTQAARRRDVQGYPRPRGATPMRASLVPAYKECTSGNRTHGSPFALPSCNPPVQSSSVLTVGTLDANGQVPKSVASARFDTIGGSSSNTVDDADVRARISMTDVRNNPSLTDYSGRVLVTTQVQITDRNNAAETPDPATTQTLPIKIPVDCTVTADTSVGSSCTLNMTLDALVPNTVVEGQRSIWELRQIEVKDAGPNGTGYASCPPTCGDGDEAVFLRQGIFIP